MAKEEKLKEGDIVEVQWAGDTQWICPICGFHNNYNYYCEISGCENCESAFEEMQCLRIYGIKRPKENGIKLEVSSLSSTRLKSRVSSEQRL